MNKNPFDARILRLTVKRQWFELIANGIKKEEYRDGTKSPAWIQARVNAFRTYDFVEFKNGYGPHVPTCLVQYLGYTYNEKGKEEWGALPGKDYPIIIKLGEVVSVKNYQPNSSTDH